MYSLFKFIPQNNYFADFMHLLSLIDLRSVEIGCEIFTRK